MKVSNKIQIVVLGIKANKAYVLLLKTTERRGSFWQNITGNVEDEGFLSAAKRELKEETGIESANIIELNKVFQFIDQYNRKIEEYSFAVLIEPFPSKINLSKEEHSEYLWKPVTEIQKTDYGFESNYNTFKHSLKVLKNKSLI